MQAAAHKSAVANRASVTLQVSAGGSLSNTLVALARLGCAEDELRASGALRIGMAAVAGSDPQVSRLPAVLVVHWCHQSLQAVLVT